MTCPKCNGTGEDWTNVSTESGALNGEDCSCRERVDLPGRSLDDYKALRDAYDRERQRTRSGVRTPAPGYENGYVSGTVHAAVCRERDAERDRADSWERRALELEGISDAAPSGRPDHESGQ